LVACVGTWSHLASEAPVIASDGVRYVQMAREWSDAPLRVIREEEYHVGYPVVISWAHAAIDTMGLADGPASWDLAGRAVSMTAGAATVTAVWLLGGLIVSWRAAWIGAMVFGLGQNWSHVAADVVSDGLAVCFQAWGAVLLLLAARRLGDRRRGGLLLAGGMGILAGLGYLVRPEALLLCGLAAVVWVAQTRDQQGGWKRTAGAVALAGGCAIAAASPYMIAIGGISKKKRIGELFSAAGAGPHLQTLALAPLDLGVAIYQLSGEFMEAIHPIGLSLVSIWLLTWIGWRCLGLKLPESVRLGPTRIGGWLIVSAAVAICTMLVALHLHAGYISSRHLMFLVVLLSPLAGAGACVLAVWLSSLLKSTLLAGPARWLALPLVALGLAGGLLAHTLEPLHEGKQPHRRAARYVAQRAADGDIVATDSPWVIHYGGWHQPRADYLRIPPALPNLARQRVHDGPADYLVLSDEATHLLQPLGAGDTGLRFQHLETLSARDAAPEDRVHVYAVRPAIPATRPDGP
ncbi:MAG: hypothetical protein ACOC93_05230, partial [Planctomycetota bacterium]